MGSPAKTATFRDILTAFLEEKAQKKPVTDPAPALEIPVFRSQMSEIPFVFLDIAIPKVVPTRGAYPRVATVGKLRACSRNGEKSQVFSREMLSHEGQVALDQLNQLGALDLGSDLTEALIKKAYRRLLKFYHPDHYPLGLLPEERLKRGEQFLELQRVYKTLAHALKKIPSRAACDTECA